MVLLYIYNKHGVMVSRAKPISIEHALDCIDYLPSVLSKGLCVKVYTYSDGIGYRLIATSKGLV